MDIKILIALRFHERMFLFFSAQAWGIHSDSVSNICDFLLLQGSLMIFKGSFDGQTTYYTIWIVSNYIKPLVGNTIIQLLLVAYQNVKQTQLFGPSPLSHKITMYFNDLPTCNIYLSQFKTVKNESKTESYAWATWT